MSDEKLFHLEPIDDSGKLPQHQSTKPIQDIEGDTPNTITSIINNQHKQSLILEEIKTHQMALIKLIETIFLEQKKQTEYLKNISNLATILGLLIILGLILGFCSAMGL